MITKVSNTISHLKNLWIETFLNQTNKVSDITENSVLNGIAYASAKVAQKCLKDIAIVETQLFPETAAEQWLDRCAQLFGVPARGGALGSSTYVCVFAAPGTAYVRDEHVFTNVNGVRFVTEEDAVVGDYGYAYIRVRSESTGEFTNVAPGTILRVTPVPQGHIACANEYYAVGGRDRETDDVFRRRILNYQNIHSQSTFEKLTQALQQIDSRVLRVMSVGLMEDSYYHIQIISQNGQVFSDAELSSITEQLVSQLSIWDSSADGSSAIKLENAQWYIVGGEARGVDFRCEIDSSYDLAAVRRSIQIGLTKYLDWRTWSAGRKIEWTDLFEIIKNTPGVKYLSSEDFYPNEVETVPDYMLPRFKKFTMRALDGTVLVDASAGEAVEQRYNELFPAYYPSNI